ncbi:MAG TPA: hypothetical protein VK421_12020 [Pyrinomonadaceae bacterium]|nr:hypothetical protein [Pyrinomonadaceae bacterium]
MRRIAAYTLALALLSGLGLACDRSRSQSGGDAANQGGSNNMKSQDEAARKALEALPQLVTNDTFKGMGFGSPEEARAAQLGSPVPHKTIAYDRLLQYQPGTRLEQLFAPEEQVVYPIQVGGAVKSSIVVTNNRGAWQISSVGDSYLGNVLAQATASRAAADAVLTRPPEGGPSPAPTEGRPTPSPQQPAATPTQPDALQLVSIPGLNLDFVAFNRGDRWALIPARDHRELQLSRGRAVSAEQMLPALSNYAREFDRKYGDQIRRRRLVK